MLTIEQLIESYDKPGMVILLEGKRAVSTTDQHKLIGVGKLLAGSTKHVIFRSGNAKGAHYYFSQGIAQVDPSRLQIITPYPNHRNKSNLRHQTVSLDDIDLISLPDVILYQK